MAARAAEDFTSTSPILERFHPNCGRGITLSENRRVAHGDSHSALRIAFSNDPIANGLKFSVKILQKGSAWVNPISASSRHPTLDAPYTAGGAVHVVHCCLFFV